MRYLIGFIFVLAGLAALPLRASAQDTEADTTSERNLQEPALRLVGVDSTGVVFTLIPSSTVDGYTLEEMELRVKRAKIGLGVSAGISVLGVALLIPGVVGECRATYSTTPRCDPLTITGATFIMAGLVGMITTGFLSLRRTRDRDWLRPADYGTRRRVQWDLAHSRLVF